MKKFAAVAVVAAAAVSSLGIMAGPASAANVRTDAVTVASASQFGPWKPIPQPAATARLCNTKMRITYPVNAEQQRTRLDRAGNTITEVRGRLVIDLRPVATRRQYIFDVSGQSLGQYASIAYKNGDFLFAGTGSNFFGLSRLEQRETGLTHGARADTGFVVTQGPIRLLFDHAKQQNADLVTRPQSVLDVCKLINGS